MGPKIVIPKKKKLKKKKTSEKIQNWIYGHVQKCIKMFKLTCYKYGGEMDKNNIRGIIDSRI